MVLIIQVLLFIAGLFALTRRFNFLLPHIQLSSETARKYAGILLLPLITSLLFNLGSGILMGLSIISEKSVNLTDLFEMVIIIICLLLFYFISRNESRIQ